jgi:adenylate cyclase
LQDLARPAGMTVASEATVTMADDEWTWESLGACDVKGRAAPVAAYRLGAPIQSEPQKQGATR